MSIKEMFEEKWNPKPNNEPPDFFDRLWSLIVGIVFIYLILHNILLYGFDITLNIEISKLYKTLKSIFQ